MRACPDGFEDAFVVVEGRQDDDAGPMTLLICRPENTG
jgi:hypothetical protein